MEFGGNTSCVEVVAASGERFVIDAGTGIRGLGDYLLESGQSLQLTLLLTHNHWDHVLGMPFFKPIYLENTQIDVDGCPKGFYGLAAIFDDRKGNGFFPVAFDDLKAHISYLDVLTRGPLTIGNVVIEGIELNHPQGGMGFRFREDERSFAFMTDNELRTNGPIGRRLDDYAFFAQGCDLLIHDAQYLPKEISSHRGWGHSTYIDAIRLALAAGIPRLILFHHDPCRTDRQIRDMEKRARQYVKEQQAQLDVSAAREGEIVHL